MINVHEAYQTLILFTYLLSAFLFTFFLYIGGIIKFYNVELTWLFSLFTKLKESRLDISNISSSPRYLYAEKSITYAEQTSTIKLKSEHLNGTTLIVFIQFLFRQNISYQIKYFVGKSYLRDLPSVFILNSKRGENVVAKYKV
jgi:hypothetical protein